MPEKLSSDDYGCSLGLKDLFFGHHCRFQYSQHPCQGLVGSSWIFSATALIHFRHWQRASGQEGVVWFLTCLQQECWLDVMAFIAEIGITWKIYRYIMICVYIYSNLSIPFWQQLWSLTLSVLPMTSQSDTSVQTRGQSTLKSGRA